MIPISNIAGHLPWAAVVAGAFVFGEALETEPARKPEKTRAGQAPITRGTEASPASTGQRLRSSTRTRIFASDMAAVKEESDEALREIRANRLINAITPATLSGMTEDMVPGLLGLFQEVQGTLGVSRRTMEAYRDFIGSWARLDPAAAAAHVADSSNDYYIWKVFPGSVGSYMAGVNQEARENAIREWAIVDLGAAKEFLAGVSSERARKEMTLGLMKQLVENDLDGAVAYSAELEAGGKDILQGPEMATLVGQLREQQGMDGFRRFVGGVEHVVREDGSLSLKQRAVVALGETS